MDKERFILECEGMLCWPTDTTRRDDCDGHLSNQETVDLLNEQDNEIQAQSNVIEGYQERNEKLFKETQELQKRIDRQAELLQKQGEEIDNYIDIKAKLDGKIQEYTTKSEEYELSAWSCSARRYAHGKQALEELKEELFC